MIQLALTHVIVEEACRECGGDQRPGMPGPPFGFSRQELLYRREPISLWWRSIDYCVI